MKVPKNEKLALRLKVSGRGAVSVFKDPRYIVIAIAGIFLFGTIVLWSLNVSFARYVLFDLPVSMPSKLQIIFWDPLWSIFTTYKNTQAISILTFSLLSGINLAILVYVLRNKGLKNIPKKSGFGGTVFAILAGGCAACGTSLLAPLVAPLAAFLGVASGAFVRDLTVFLNWAASILIIYSIYKLGLLASSAKAEAKLASSA